MTSSTINILGDRLELTDQRDGNVLVRLTSAQRLGPLTALSVPAGDLRAALDEVAPRDPADSPAMEVDAAMLRRVQESLRMDGWVVRDAVEPLVRALRAALTPTPVRPAWLDAPAVLAWHKNDGRTEHDGTPGVKRIWSPDYRQTETWSTPSLRNVHWSDLRDVEPLGVGGGEDA